MTADCIRFDIPPSQYSAHEGFFLFSANKPIPGHKLQNPPAPEMRSALCSCERAFGCQVFGSDKFALGLSAASFPSPDL